MRFQDSRISGGLKASPRVDPDRVRDVQEYHVNLLTSAQAKKSKVIVHTNVHEYIQDKASFMIINSIDPGSFDHHFSPS